MRIHPRAPGIYGLLFAEFWERFSYFAGLSVFAFYLNERLKLSEGRASGMAGTYAALSYFMPLAGGWLADRVLGSRRTLLAGAFFLFAGYAVLMHASLWAIYSAIVLLTLGSGLFKPNITTCLGALFDRVDDSRRQAAFRSFYFCVNVAAAVAPLAIGVIKSRLGWTAAFAACALSMLVCFCALASARVLPQTCAAASKPPTIHTPQFAGAGGLAVLCVPTMAFFAVFSQSLGTLIFWARDRVDLTLGGWLASPISPTATCSLIPLLVILLLPVVEPLRQALISRESYLRILRRETRIDNRCGQFVDNLDKDEM